MAIDWVTTLAQIINFLILVALLRIFLFRPIVKAMDGREAKIAARLAEAEEKNNQAEQEKELYRAKNLELENMRNEKLTQLKMETESLKKELVKSARKEVDQIQAKWKETLQEEKNTFLTELRRRACEQTCAVARNALRDLANSDLEKLALDVFLKRIEEMDENEREIIKNSLIKSNSKIRVNTSFEISGEMKQVFIDLLREQFVEKIEAEFYSSSDLIFGIELIVHDHKIAWSLEHYLDDLEKNINEAFPQNWEENSKLSESKI